MLVAGAAASLQVPSAPCPGVCPLRPRPLLSKHRAVVPLPSQGRGSEPLICLPHDVMATKEHLETRPHVHPHGVHT